MGERCVSACVSGGGGVRNDSMKWEAYGKRGGGTGRRIKGKRKKPERTYCLGRQAAVLHRMRKMQERIKTKADLYYAKRQTPLQSLRQMREPDP